MKTTVNRLIDFFRESPETLVSRFVAAAGDCDQQYAHAYKPFAESLRALLIMPYNRFLGMDMARQVLDDMQEELCRRMKLWWEDREYIRGYLPAGQAPLPDTIESKALLSQIDTLYFTSADLGKTAGSIATRLEHGVSRRFMAAVMQQLHYCDDRPQEALPVSKGQAVSVQISPPSLQLIINNNF